MVFAAKLLVSAACLYFVLSATELNRVGASLVEVSLGVFVLGVILHVTSYLAGALRWWKILAAMDVNVSFRTVFPSYYMGVFFNNFLPTGFGGDVARTLQLRARGISGSALVVSAILDRLFGFLAVALIGFLLTVFHPLPQLGLLPVTVFSLALAVLIPIILLSFRPQPVRRLAARVKGRFPRLSAVIEKLPLLGQHPGLVSQSVVLSILNQLLVVGVVWICARNLGISIDVSSATIIVFLAFLTMALPISVGGLGVREAALVALLVQAGYAAQPAVALSLVYVAILWITAVPGAIVWLFQSRQSSKEKATLA